MRLNGNVLETWINQTLKDAGRMEETGGGMLVKGEKKKPIKRYGIDRESLRVSKD